MAAVAGRAVRCSPQLRESKSYEVSSSGRSIASDFGVHVNFRSDSATNLSCRYVVRRSVSKSHLVGGGDLADDLPRICRSFVALDNQLVCGRDSSRHLRSGRWPSVRRFWNEETAGNGRSARHICKAGSQEHREVDEKMNSIFEVEDPRRNGYSRLAWEVLWQDVLYLDWRARQDVFAIKSAHDKVVEVLNPLAREQKSVGTFRQQLAQLQEELARAHDRVHFSEARVEHSLKKLAELETALKSTQYETEIGIAPEKKQMRSRSTDSRVEVSYEGIGSAATNESASLVSQVPVAPGGRPLTRKLDISGRPAPYPQCLKNFWYPVAFTRDMGADTLIPFESFEEPWVLFRGKDGRPGCVRDECAHRACPLSLGTVTDGRIQCPYHGWEYSTDGECQVMPSVRRTKAARVRSLPCIERDGMVWIWPGDQTPETIFPSLNPPSNFTIHAEIILEMPVEHGLLMENLLDLAHAPFTHTSTFAKGWPVPNFVRFKTPSFALSGNWDPYPIDMAFQPPCMVLSTIGLVKPGQLNTSAEACPKHLHQLHVCMPSTRGKTRLLYRMALDFAHWAKYVPFIDKLWMYLANQVLNEDLRLVEGQQERMERGANVWRTPVAYDKLGIRYRLWRIAVESGNQESSF